MLSPSRGLTTKALMLFFNDRFLRSQRELDLGQIDSTQSDPVWMRQQATLLVECQTEHKCGEELADPDTFFRHS